MALPFLRRNAWKLAAAFTAAVALAYVFLRDTQAGPTVYAFASLLAFVAFATGPALQGTRALQWKLFAAGMGMYTLADASWAVYTWLGWTQPYPSWADGAYLSAYVLFALGVLVLLRGRRPRAGDVLDGLLIAAAAASVIWLLLIQPIADEAGTRLVERLVSAAYPTMDVLLLAGVAPLVLASRLRCRAYWALVAGFGVMMTADLLYAVLNLKGLYGNGSSLDLAWIAANGLLAVAALHPSIRLLSVPVKTEPGKLGFGRMSIVAGALLVRPLLTVVLLASGHRSLTVEMVVASGIATLLVLLRLRLLWRERDQAEEDLRTSESRYRELYAVAEAGRDQLTAQNDQLLELDRLKDEFVGLVSHELRTPLTSIRGYLDLLVDAAPDTPAERRQDFLEIVDRNANRLLTLIDDLLFITQIGAGKLVLELDELELASVARECAAAAQPLARERQIAFEVVEYASPIVKADRSRLTQVLDNLISNALKFTPPGGRVELRIDCDETSAKLEVTDTGIGIAESDLPHMFSPFFRAASASSASIPGTGLGLAISKGIVETHGGAISVRSEEGRGSTFRIELPCDAVAVEARGEPAEDQALAS
ncbi:MAG: sensor histidine kinase [Gaiellaceae bacterium]